MLSMRTMRPCAVAFILACVASAANAHYSVSAATLGRRFDGVGGLSGGGATSRLLPTYQEKTRNQILDYLFKPNFGASLTMLKVEIGGDAQSTDGGESSHMHSKDDLNYQRGYEWWLMTEAKKRNPNIALYALPWTFPGWVGNGTGNPYAYPELTADYIVKYVAGAKSAYDLTIDYVGCWNERNYDSNYLKTLRRALTDNGFNSTKIVAADQNWNIAKDMLSDPELFKVVDVIGAHYPGTTSSPEALKTGKKLWASEDYSTVNNNIGAGCWARILNQNYVNGAMTNTISWNLIAAYYPQLPFGWDGLMTAVEPWSGNYVVNAPIWGTAHTTQFVSAHTESYYLPVGSGSGKLDQGGSFVSFVTHTQDQMEYTLVIEKMSHDHSQCIRPYLPPYSTANETAQFVFEGQLKEQLSVLFVWRTCLQFGAEKQDENEIFRRMGTVPVSNGILTFSIDVDCQYTLSTTNRAQKGSHGTPPPRGPFPTPYADNFDSYPMFQEASYFADQAGTFEIRPATVDVSAHKTVMRQVVPEEPITWRRDIAPHSVMGSNSWADQTVTVDVLVEQSTGAAMVGARASGDVDNTLGAYFVLGTDGWSVSNSIQSMHAKQSLTSGTVPSCKVNQWYTIKIAIVASEMSVWVEGALVLSNFTVSKIPKTGWASIGTRAWDFVQFDNFRVSAITPSCAAPAVAQPVNMVQCSGEPTNAVGSAPGVEWVYTSAQAFEMKTSNHSQSVLCLETTGSGTIALLSLQPCDPSRPSQQWSIDSSDSTIRQAGKCLDVDAFGSTPGTPVDLYQCNGGANQQFTYDTKTGLLFSDFNQLCVGVCMS